MIISNKKTSKMENETKLYVQTCSEELLHLLRNSLKYKGSFDSWLNKILHKHSVSRKTNDWLCLAAGALVKLDVIMDKAFDKEKAIKENEELVEIAAMFARKIDLATTFKSQTTLYSVLSHSIETLGDGQDVFEQYAFTRELIAHQRKFVIKIPNGSGIFIGHPNEYGAIQRELSEIYFRFLPDRQVKQMIANAKRDQTSEIGKTIEQFQSVLHILFVSTNSRLGTYCEDHYFTLVDGACFFSQVHGQIYSLNYPLDVEQSLHKAANIALKMALVANDLYVLAEDAMMSSEVKISL